jgi:uncharacterized membrane protein YkvI
VASWFRRYLLPGFVFQSIIIAGGYGTGRELVEFFLRYGPLGGLLGMLLPSTLVASLTAMASFEFARVFRAYDYRRFFQRLLGRGWVLYEINYLVAVLLVLAVIGAAAGTFLSETFGLPIAVGAVILLVAIGFLVFKGTSTIEGFLAAWSFVLYGTYLVFFVWSLTAFGDAFGAALAGGEATPGWVLSGLRYGALQISLLPAVLFATRHIRERREALWAGALVGPIAIIPGVLFYLAMVGHYPEILERPLPANYLLELLGSRSFQVAFQLVLFGTLIETGSGLIHAFNERISGVFQVHNYRMPPSLRPAIAVGLLVAGFALSRLGLIELIGKGYGALTWVSMAIVVVPVLTIGVARIRAATTAGPQPQVGADS